MSTWAPPADLDPQWQAIVAALEAQQAGLQAGTQMRASQLNDDYAYQLAQARASRPQAEKRLFGNHLARGVAMSGGASRQRAEQAAGFVQQDEDLAFRLQAGLRSADAELQTRLADLRVKRATEEAASQGRVAAREQELANRWITAGGGYTPGSILGSAASGAAASAPTPAGPVYSTVPGYETVLQSDIDKWVAAGGPPPVARPAASASAPAPYRPPAPRPVPAPPKPPALPKPTAQPVMRRVGGW